MVDVRRFPFDKTCRTQLWLSDKALHDISRFRKKGDPDKAFWKKVKKCAEAGFWYFEVGRWPIVKAEFGVYRFGIRDSLFRMIGFYSDDTKAEFVVLDTLLKSGQDLSRADVARIKEVAKIKQSGTWRKVDDEEDFPRAAQRP